MLKRFFNRKTSRKNSNLSKKKAVPKQKITYAHHWDHPRAYMVAVLVIIGMLIVPIYNGMAVKSTGHVVFDETPQVNVQTQTQPADSCADTDGKNYDVKGTVNAMSDGISYMFEDSCSGSVLKEYYCNSGHMASSLKKCANGCNDGACLP